MALVVFLRGVNVGKHKRFLPSQLAKDLAALDVVNVGAAGTFIVRAPVTRAALLDEMRTRLAFDAEVFVVKGSDLLAFARGAPFGARPPAANEQRFLSVMKKALASSKPQGAKGAPMLPVFHPTGDNWQVKIVEVAGTLVASLWRRQPGTPIYPNAAVEKQLGVATTRNWNTFETICRLIEA